MVTILLEQIIELLKGFIDSFKDHAAEVAEKLGLISEDTSDINDNTDTIVSLDSAIKDNTDILVANTGAIKNSSQATSVNTAAIASDTTVIRNNINTISVNSGRTAAFTEDTATNTLNILDKVTTIASDTTQMRSTDDNIYTRLNTMYTQLDWLLYGVDYINEVSGDSPVIFNTDKPLIPIKKIISFIDPIQAGTGFPSHSNIRTISGFSSANIGINNDIFNIPFNETVYGGILDVIGGKLSVDKIAVNLGSLNWSYITSGNFPRFQAPIPTPGSGCEDNTKIANIICEIFGTTSWTNVSIVNDYDGYLAENANGGYITVHDSNYTSVSDFVNAVSGKKIVYEVATPTEISLTPISIEQILGDNVVTTDTNGGLIIAYIESLRNHINS